MEARQRDGEFNWKFKRQPATRSGSSCSTMTSSTTATSGYESAMSSSTSSFSLIETNEQTETRKSSVALKSIKFATESAIFNFDKSEFEFEGSENLTLRDIQQQPPSSNAKDFFCYFGPSGSVTEKCVGCKMLIKERFLTVGESVYHPNCFKCSKCSIKLGSGSHFEDNGAFYCKKDYLELFSEKCSKCSKPLGEEFVHIGEMQLHFKCFTCKTCHIKLDGYMEKDGEYYCEKHFKELHSPRCKKCRKLCTQKFYRLTDGQVFHHQCFTCAQCGVKMKKHFLSEGRYFCSLACANK